MSDPLLVSGFEGSRDLPANGKRLAYRDGAGQIVSRNQLQDQKVGPLALVQIVNGGDVGVVQSGQDLRFAPEPGDALRVLRHGFRQHLDGDFAAQLGIERPVDFAHTSGPDLLEDAIVGERPAEHGHQLLSV